MLVQIGSPDDTQDCDVLSTVAYVVTFGICAAAVLAAVRIAPN
jgi:hypothetical protein